VSAEERSPGTGRARTVATSSELASGKLLLDAPAEHVVRLTISNPQRRGALDHEILDGLAETVRSLDARCLVLTGTDPMFSAGYDIGNLNADRPRTTTSAGDTAGKEFERDAEALVAHPFHAAIEALEAYEYPVIAQINGHAIGGGLGLALTADIRIAARGVNLGMPPAKLGLVYSHTGLKRFVEVCGVAHTSELFYTGRNVDSDRGAEIGWSTTWSTLASWRSARWPWRRRSPPTPLCRNRATSGSCGRCVRGRLRRSRSGSSSSCASRAFAPRTSARASGPSGRSALPCGRAGR